MLLKCGRKILHLDDKYVLGCPLLETMLWSSVDMTTESTPNGDAIVLDYSLNLKALKQYLRYLQGKGFRMTRRVERIFQYMGHEPRGNKPMELWKAELQDQWTRDNFDRLDLWKDPYYGLVKVKIDEKRGYCYSWDVYPGNQFCALGFNVLRENYISLAPHYWADDSSIPLARAIIGEPPNGNYKCNDSLFLVSKEYPGLICWRKTWKSPNEIAFFHPISFGIVSINGSNIIAMTHTARYRLRKGTRALYGEALSSLEKAIPCIRESTIHDPGDPRDDYDEIPLIHYTDTYLKRHYDGLNDYDPSHCQREEFLTFE